MRERSAWILVGGPLADTAEVRRRRLDPPDLVIAADGGVEHAALLGVRPDVWVGDFDSSDPLDPRFVGVPRVTVSGDKDFTDAELALSEARARGAARVTFWGAFGGRADHALALALLALRLAREGLRAELHGGDESAEPLRPDAPLALATVPGQRLSVVAFDDLTGLAIEGARWPLSGAFVRAGSGRTVSNEARGAEVRLSVASGRALIVRGWP